MGDFQKFKISISIPPNQYLKMALYKGTHQKKQKTETMYYYALFL